MIYLPYKFTQPIAGDRMAKAHIETPDGVVVKLEGTPEEISTVLKDIKVKGKDAPAKKAKAGGKRTGRVTFPSLAEDLREDGFFKKPKSLGEIKSKLADLGHNYPLTGLSGPMRTEVKNRRLRRFKEKGKYVYAE
jgi:hypothetical protein